MSVGSKYNTENKVYKQFTLKPSGILDSKYESISNCF